MAELGGELGAAADRPLLHQFSQLHAGADAGVLAQLSLPGVRMCGTCVRMCKGVWAMGAGTEVAFQEGWCGNVGHTIRPKSVTSSS